MSPRTKPPGPWADDATLRTIGDEVWVEFRDVPCGSETTDVLALVGVDPSDRLAIVGLRLSLPMTAPRMKALPIAAIRRAAGSAFLTMGFHPGGEGWNQPGGDASHLRYLRDEDPKSREFLRAVAAHCRESRATGQPVTEDLAKALSVGISTAERYIRAAREAGFDTGTAAPPKTKTKRGTTSPRKRG